MRNSYGVIAIDNFVILNTFQNFYIPRTFFFCLLIWTRKHVEPNIGKIFKTNTILITKYLNLNWNIVKSSIINEKMIDFK